MDRTKGIGGSDIHHLFNIPPYGCRRGLWYEKLGVEADFPFMGNDATRRGKRFERFVIQEYEHERNKTVIVGEKETEFAQGCFSAHLDGIIYEPYEEGNVTHGVLEAKVPGMNAYLEIKKNGLPERYVMQMQWYLGITGYKWGEFAIFWPDGFKFLFFEAKPDEDLIRLLQDAASGFWEDNVKNKEEVLRLPDINDKRCKSCPWRLKCRGQQFLDEDIPMNEVDKLPETNELIPSIEAYQESKDIYKKAEEYRDTCKEKLLAKMKGDAAKTSDFYVKKTAIKTKRWDGKKLEFDHPELIKEYKKESVSQRLTIKERREPAII